MEERPARKPMKRSSRRKVCVFCQEKVQYIDYKDVNRLKKFITEGGKILPRRMSGVCAMHQRELSNAITACNKTRAVKLVDKLVDDGEEPVAILSKMTFPILKMARVKRLSEAGLAPAEILRAAGLMYWESRLVNQARSFPPQKNFLNALNRIIDADSALKSSSGADPKILLKGILLTLFSK